MVKFIKIDILGDIYYLNATSAMSLINTITNEFLTRVVFKYSSTPNNVNQIDSYGITSIYDYILEAYTNAISSSANHPIYDPAITQGTQPLLNAIL